MQNPETPNISRSEDSSKHNRAFDTRRDNDTFIVPSITIYDIDYAILYFLQNRITPQIEENGVTVNVPIIFANGEKWVQIQRQGFLRDSNRKIMAPLISIRRISMVEDDRFSKLRISNNKDGANSLIIYPVTQRSSEHDIPRANTQQSYEYYVSAIPTNVRVSYELILWADKVHQLNSIVESIVPNDNVPWGDVFQFVTKIQDYSFDITNNIGEDRIARCTIPIQVDAFLQPEFNLKESVVQKAHTLKRIVLKNEVEQENFIVDYLPKEIRPSEERLLQRTLNNKMNNY